MPPNDDLKRWKVGDPITAEALNALRGAIPKITAGNGIEVIELRGRTTISLAGRLAIPKQTFWARVTSATLDSPNRWRYSVDEVVKTGAGYGGWTVKEGGRSGPAFNTIEDINDGAGLEGMGINIDGADFPPGFSVRRAPAGTPVLITVVTMADGSAKEYWFSFGNNVDGICEGIGGGGGPTPIDDSTRIDPIDVRRG